MDDQSREADRSGWDDIRPAPVDRLVARRPTQRKAPSTLGWYHVRWIAINIALIAVTAWLYIHFLIPRILGNPSGGQQNVAVAAASIDRETTPVEPRPMTADSVQRLRREPERADPATMEALKNATGALKAGRARCVGGHLMTDKIVRGTRTFEPITYQGAGLTCND